MAGVICRDSEEDGGTWYIDDGKHEWIEGDSLRQAIDGLEEQDHA